MSRLRALAAALLLLSSPAFCASKKVEVPGTPGITPLAVPALPTSPTQLFSNVHAYGPTTVNTGDLHAYGAMATQQHAYGHPTVPGQDHAYGVPTPDPRVLVPQSAQAAQGAQNPLAPVSEELSKTDLSPSQAKQAADADWAPRVGENVRPLEIMQIAAEAVPFVKTGGLADVLDGLSREFAAKGHKVTLVLPNYKNLKRDGLELTKVGQVAVPLAGRTEHADILHARKDGVDVWLLDGALFNGRDGPYADSGQLHQDNDERFIMLARAALEAAKALGKKPDVVHAHDWHAALVAPMLKLLYHDEPAFAGTRSVVTIHNIAYQGDFAPESVRKAGFSLHDFTYDKLEHWGKFNFLKSGLQYADAVTTVSPNYAKETLTKEFGVGLEGLLNHRKDSYHGIINGLDADQWAPDKTEMLVNYGFADVEAGKAYHKKLLQERFGLDVDPNKPLFSVLSRVDPQKGIDLVVQTAGVIDGVDGQLFISGGAKSEPELDHLAESMPGRFFRHHFDLTLPKLLLAASDFLLMPSRFEPCGLSQLQAMLMGTIPIVTPVGGLKDTVRDVSLEGGDGIVLRGVDAISVAEGVARARRLYDQPEKLAQARKNAMSKDVSWDKPAESYLELFRRLVFGEPK